MGRVLFILCAVGLHLAFILFGGLLFGQTKEDKGTLRTVDLLSTEEEAKKEEKPEEKKPEDTEEIASDEEPIPEAAEVMETDDLATPNEAPALEAASLSAIEAALNGQGAAGGDFGIGASLQGGGVIGGTGRAGAGTDTMDDIMTATEVDQQARAVFQANALYPAEMRGKKIEGTVTCIFVVDATGKVQNPRVAESSHAAFEKPALDALRQWKFEPGLRGGERVPSKMRVTIRFRQGE